MSTLIAHPTGNQFFRAAVDGIYETGALAAAYTCLATFPRQTLYAAGKFPALSDLRRRAFNPEQRNLFHTYPLRELARLLATKFKLQHLTRHETGIFSTDAVYQSFDKYVSRQLEKYTGKGLTSFYGYEDGSLASFQQAKKSDLKCIYDLPIGYWKAMHQVLSEEKESNPAWSSTLEGLKDSPKKLSRKDEEIKLADVIVVASTFTKNTLAHYTGELPPIEVVPYGFPPPFPRKFKKTRDKLRLLYVGSLGQRKGIGYLFEALNGLDNYVELTVVGRYPGPYPDLLKKYLQKYTWFETLPHTKVLELMRVHDLLVFPSLFEGFGMVISEAMSQGTPVITTYNTAGPDIINDGINGWLINSSSSTAIQNKLMDLLEQPDAIETAGNAALQTAKGRPWSSYAHDIARLTNTYN